ncbi:hypothetical protein L6R52_17195, partial [Myxococcota bacterium]|nr:hypothetical protein [Myxococcota bacterium]
MPQSSDIVASMVIPLLVTSIAAPASGPVFLDAGTLTSSLAAALEAEGCAVEAAREDADTWVTAELGGDGLALRVVTAEGRLLLERALSVGPGLGAALRTSALLVEEALSAERAVEATRRPAWTLSAAARVSLWLDPATPSTGFAIAAHVPLGPVRAGARASVDGLACCTITRPSAVSASSFATALALELSLPIAGAGRVELSADAALGAGLRRVTSTVESFAAP